MRLQVLLHEKLCRGDVDEKRPASRVETLKTTTRVVMMEPDVKDSYCLLVGTRTHSYIDVTDGS